MNKKKEVTLKMLLGKANTPFEKFFQASQISKFKEFPDKSQWPVEWKKIYYKNYPRLKQIILPAPHLSEISLKEALLKRKTERSLSKKIIDLEQISTLLYYGCGLRNKNSRFYPSAGERYPLEVYLLSLRTDLPKGVYHYNIRAHALEELELFKNFNFKAFFTDSWVKNASFVIIISAIFDRTTHKYGERGYRYILQEVGHLSQNLLLVATALNLKSAPTGGYSDTKMNTLLDLNPQIEASLMTITFGI